MNMDEYGDEVEKLILTHGKTYVDKRLMENTLGLVGEAGEFAEKIKKHIRDGNEISQLELVKELGDVSKSDLVRACGYVSNKKDGGDRLNFLSKTIV